MLNSKSYSQTIVIDSTFNSNTEIFPFNQNDTIYGLGITGHITLNSDTSLIRVIFLNSDFEEYLLYEAYPYIADDWDFDIVNESDETKYLPTTEPYSIIIQTSNASLNLTSLICTSIMSENPDSLQELHKESVEQNKISSINSNIQEYEMLWFADETSVSQLSYSDKKSMFGEIYNLHGLDYYSGGIYSAVPGFDGPIEVSSLVPDFDWRNRHGADDPIKDDFYYDPDGDGWLTDIKDQTVRDNCTELCYIYGPVAVLEGLTDLYFNQQLNLDLSEQHVLDCDGNTTNECDGGQVYEVNLFLKNIGVVNETCYPAQSPQGYCPPVFTYPLEQECQIKIQGFTLSSANAEIKREGIILHGPLVTEVSGPGYDPSHAMALIGFGTLKSGDVFHSEATTNGQTIYVDEHPEYIGRTYWIYKNSWGQNWGDQGYMYHLESKYTPTGCRYYNLPIENVYNNPLFPSDQAWDDKDKDGYYWWGIGDKPTACPGPGTPDSDDSEPRIGPYDDNYYGTPVKPIIEVSVFGQTIHNGGFYPINNLSQSIDIVFDVRNMGDAQLNFEEISAFPDPYANVTLAGNDAGSFSYGGDLATELAMNGESGDQDNFTISYNGACTTTYTCVVTIHLDEIDMEDFTFAIVYADCDHIPSNERITSNVTWDGWNVILDNYNVEDGGELTITGHVGFSDQVNLIVEPGGRLILDGGVLTNVCGNTWSGIDVWGDKNISQYPNSNQGYLAIKNGGKIQNAEIAVQVAQATGLDTYNVLSTGGIVKCDSAIFINNPYDVVIYPYENINPGTGEEAPNYCTFKNSYFLTTYPFEEEARNHVYLRGVDGIRFRGCTFENETDFVDTHLNEKIDVGIFSHNSGFYVEDYCMNNSVPCNNTRRCSFTKLRYGIYAINSIYSKYICIDTAFFVNNLTGIYMSAVEDQRITSNDISINHYEDFEVAYNSPEPIGIYIESCKNYMIEENLLKNESSIGNAQGIHILNSGQDYNEIYNNQIVGYYTGIIAVGENRDSEGAGLCILCNDFWDCYTDIAVRPEIDSYGNPIVGSTIGIANSQHINYPSYNDPAGNSFTRNPTGDNYINDSDCEDITYVHHDNEDPPRKIKPNPYSVDEIVLEEDIGNNYTKESACPSNLSTQTDTQSEMLTISVESALIQAFEDTVSIYVDGGNTEDLNLDIQTSFPNEAEQIRQNLLGESPYLSDTVMETAIAKENVLPNAMIRDVLVANPQSAKSVSIMNRVHDRFVPMPDYMLNEIEQGKYTIGALEILEKNLAKHRSIKERSFGNLLSYYKRDTLSLQTSRDSLIALFSNDQKLNSKYSLSLLFLSAYDSLNAFSVLNNIPSSYELNIREENTYNLYDEYLELLWSIKTDTICIDSLTIAKLNSIADNERSLPGIFARNILISEQLLSYSEPIYYPDHLKSCPVSNIIISTHSDDGIIKLFPNPAASYFIIEYEINGYYEKPILSITNTKGQLIESFQIQDSHNQRVISTKNLSPGIYIVNLTNGYQRIDSEKIIISQ